MAKGYILLSRYKWAAQKYHLTGNMKLTPLHCMKQRLISDSYISWTVLTTFFLELQKDWRRLSSNVPKPDSWIPYAFILWTSRGVGDCQSPSHHAGGRSGVRAHWVDWLWQLKGPANLFHTCPQPTWFPKPSESKLVWKLLKNQKLAPVEEFPTNIQRKRVKKWKDTLFQAGTRTLR